MSMIPETPHDAPVRMFDGRTVELPEALDDLEAMGGRPDRILHRWGEWVITDYGIECLSHPYYIEWRQVDDPDWIEHLAEKTWVVRTDVEAAFERAREMAKARRGVT